MAIYKSKFIEIDPDTCSKEELYNAIKECENLSGYYETKQLALKTFINSVYGATASKWFIGHNTDVAESITLQGQDLNHFSENCVNKYFRGIFQSQEEYNKIIYVPLFEWMEKYDIETTDEFYAKTPDKQWVLVKLPISKEDIKSGNIDKDIKGLLKKVSVKTTFGEYLGVPYEKIKEFEIHKGRITQNPPLNSYAAKAKNPLNSKENPFAYMGKASYLEDDPTCSATVNGDTDSIYVEFGRVTTFLNIIDYYDATRFVVDLWNYGCGPYMEHCYDEYAKKYNCDANLESLELEKIADTAILIAKKHYAMSECWKEPNIYLNPGEEVAYKGLELIQGSTPAFAKKCQDDFMKYVMSWYIDHTTAPEFDDIYALLKKYKEEFIKQNPEDICKSVVINDYDKFILDDKNQLVIGGKCPIHVRAAGIYNYILNQPKNKKYKMRYEMIKSRDKVKFYKTTDPNYPVFGFVPGKYSLEFALPMDYNQQFEDLVLKPLNRIVEILGYQPFTSDLCYVSSLF